MGAVPELSTTDFRGWSPRWESNPRPTPYQDAGHGEAGSEYAMAAQRSYDQRI